MSTRRRHAGGDKLFVDYAGDTVPVIIDRLSGKTRPAQIFVAVPSQSAWVRVASARNRPDTERDIRGSFQPYWGKPAVPAVLAFFCQ
jgi:transposase